MRIAHVNTEIAWGGGEAQTLYLAHGLRTAGHESILFLPPNGQLAGRARRDGFEVRDLPGAAPFLYLFREIAGGGFDVCHLHTARAVALGACGVPPGNGVARIATRRLSNPLGRNWFGWKGPWTILDHHIAVSATVRDRLVADGIPAARITVVPSAVDLDRFRPSPRGDRFRREIGVAPEAFLFGAVARLIPRKRLDRFIEAAARLWRRRPGARFALVGEGECAGRLTERIERLGLHGRVVLAGFREDVPAVLAGLDALVFPGAAGEGSPGVIKEAMTAGVPVIAVDRPVVREIVTAGRNALLVPAGDVGALAAAMERLIAEPALGPALAGRGRADSGRFSIDRMVRETAAVYHRVADERSRRRAV